MTDKGILLSYKFKVMKIKLTFSLLLLAITGVIAQTTPTACTVKISSTVNTSVYPRTVSFKTDRVVDTGSKYLWTFSDGQTSDNPTPTKYFKETKSYSATVKITKETLVCEGKYEFNYELGTPPNPTVSAKGKVLTIGTAPCATAITLDNGSTVIAAVTVPTFAYKVGQYVELSYELMPAGTATCTGISGVPVKITRISDISVCTVIISSTVNSSVYPRTVAFKTDRVIDTASKYLWTFSDGQTSDNPTPTKYFKETKSYSVSIKITNGTLVCDGKYGFNYEIGTPPVQTITAKGKVLSIGTTPCATTITLDNGTTAIASVTVPTFAYKVGQYVELSYELMPAGTATCTGISGVPVKITKISEIVVTTVCKVPITFTKSTTIPPVYTFKTEAQPDGTTYSWTFGDGGTASTTTPTHTYKVSGSYLINLRVVKNNTICYGELTETFVGETNPPLSGKGTVKINTGTSCTSIALATGGTLIPQIMATNFAFRDGQQVEFTYEKLTTKVSSCDGTDIKVLTIKEIPVTTECKAYFTSTRVEQANPKKIVFTNMSVGEISELSWNFGDNTPVSTDLKPIHEYAAAGEYKVCLIIKTKAGCTSYYCMSVKIENPITTTGCKFDIVVKPKAGTANTFLFSTVSQVDMKTLKWSFGDTKTSDAKTPEHTYENTGTYEITCVVTTALGCTETRTIKQTVLGTPATTCSYGVNLILYDATNLCNGRAYVRLLDDKLAAITANVRYLWSDGSALGERTDLCPDKTYTVQVSLENNCQKNVSFTLLSKPLWKTSSINGTTNFSVIDPKEGANYEWDFGNGNVQTGNTVNYNFATDGTYEVKLKAAIGTDFAESAQQLVVANSVTEAKIINKSEPKVYPNPANEMLMINFGDAVESKLIISIMDISGKQVYSQVLDIEGFNQAGINIQQLRSGIYFIHISDNQNLKVVRKFIKSN